MGEYPCGLLLLLSPVVVVLGLSSGGVVAGMGLRAQSRSLGVDSQVLGLQVADPGLVSEDLHGAIVYVW